MTGRRTRRDSFVRGEEVDHPTTTWPVGVFMLRRDACRVTARVDELALFAGLNASAFTALASVRDFIAPFAMMHRAMHILMTGIASPNGAVNIATDISIS